MEYYHYYQIIITDYHLLYIVIDECTAYTALDSADRSRYQGPVNKNKCDNYINGWYRFTGNAGSNMATSCVPIQHCGTHAPGWLNGKLPSLAEGAVKREVCFNWRKDCCYWKAKTIVRNCGGYYVYKLEKAPHCQLRYCGDGRVQGKGLLGITRIYWRVRRFIFCRMVICLLTTLHLGV